MAADERTAAAEDDIATPVLISPPESKTPPTASHKRNMAAFASSTQDRNSEPIDPSALSRALEQFEQAGRVRERTPTASPSRKRPRIYGDRFIPNRAGQDLQASFNLLHDDGSPATPSKSRRTPHNELHFQKSKLSHSTKYVLELTFPSRRSQQDILCSPPSRNVRRLSATSTATKPFSNRQCKHAKLWSLTYPTYSKRDLITTPFTYTIYAA